MIDWQPFLDNGGNALTFLPANNTLQFRSSQLQTFAVLNRILPDANNNIAVINGNVIAQVTNPATGAPQAGGFVAFYSPSGLLIGGTATFDVGSLMLTTLDVSPTAFENFTLGGNMTMVGAAGSTARVQINPGAQILATPENAFFAVVAADIEMRGTALVNGSHAFVAGEVVNLSFSNGLFNISVPVGTAASGEVVTVDGTVGGPSSTGITNDNHMIYGVARAGADPISMLFSGNLGFDPAQSAGIVNGEIILAANYNVFGRFVAGGNISNGITGAFQQTDGLTDVRADIFIGDFTASSSLLAVGTHQVQASAFNAASSVAGNLLLVGRQNAEIVAANGRTFTISGDVLVDSRDYGVVSSSLQSLDQINAQGGNAVINALAGSSVTISGDTLVTADAFGGADDISGIAGTARGGTAQIRGFGGSVAITGQATVSARGIGTSLTGIQTGAEARGGLAQILATQGGSASVGQSLTVRANAVAANGRTTSASSVSNAYGGQALISIFDGGGTLTVGGAVLADASATGGSSNNAGPGSIGDAGEASVSINGAGQMTFGDAVRLEAIGRGGQNNGGIGGVGLGGRASAVTFTGGTIAIDGDFDADALGAGGRGLTGGDGFGGIAGAIATLGQITIGGNGFAGAEGVGGEAGFGQGGNGGVGRGGNAAFQATGSLTQTATLTITGDATVLATGLGGRGEAPDGPSGQAGRGGDGYGGQFTDPNQADPTFNSGAFILAGGDNGRITVGGDAFASAQGFGGEGGPGITGFGGGGRGGDGFGGLAQVGLALLGFDGSVGQGTATFGNLLVQADGSGGQGGLSGLDFATGDGGDGIGGFAAFSVRAGDITAADIVLSATGNGGEGTLAGLGQGGNAGIFGSLGGTLTATRAFIQAQGFGGFSGYDLGGDGIGGTAAIEGDGISVTLNEFAAVDASGFGGDGDAGSGGNGTGGEAYIAFVTAGTPGTITVAGHAQVFANGVGGGTSGAFAAGDGFGGLARIEAQGGGSIALRSTQVTAIGQGGFANLHEGGNGTGGIVRLLAAGSGSSLTIQRNIPEDQTETLGNIFMLNANGVGEGARGGSGIGGLGQGGALQILARQGGTITLPTNVAADPNAAFPAMLFVARGFGGASEVDDGIGGAGFGGNGLIEADGAGSDIIMGETVFSVYGEGGSSALSTSNVTGGAGFGGTRRIRVLNGAEATLQLIGGFTGGVGGDGSGTGDGGDGIGGRNSVEVISSTLNIIGDLPLIDQATGGDGVIGGDALGGLGGEGGGLFLTATDSVINLLPSGNSLGRLLIGGTTQGGTGSAAGGFARSPSAVISVTNSTINGGTIQVTPIAAGGQATNPDGVGGAAIAGAVTTNITNSTLDLEGENIISSEAVGGSGGLDGQGGSATGGPVAVTVAGSSITVAEDIQTGVSFFRVQSRAVAGFGAALGDATGGSALLRVTDSALSVQGLQVFAQAFAQGSAGQTGGTARSGEASLVLSGTGTINTGVIDLVTAAFSSVGGSAFGGRSALTVESGSSVDLNAAFITLNADGIGVAGASGAGTFAINIGGGDVTTNVLLASAAGDVIAANPSASQIVVDTGSLNVAGLLIAEALGDIEIGAFGGGVIGTRGMAGSLTEVTITSRGNISFLDDDSGLVGLGGRSISLNAGGSILLDGNMATANGPISINANNGTAVPLPTGFTSAADITMTAGTSINAGTGTVTIRMGDGGGVAGRLSGAITLANISAGLIDVRNFGTDTGSDITVLGSGVLTASGSGRAIDLASLNGEVINLHGDAGLILTGGGHYGIFAATPTGSQIGSFASYARRYNVADAAVYDALNPGGNFAAFRIVPVLTVTADDITRFYGNVTPGLTASFAGFLPGDSIADLLGAPELTTLANGTSGVGLYAINAALGTLLSQQGYQFSFAGGQLTVVPRPITVTANNLSRFYGNANPALTFSVGGLGLVNGDQLSGALATTANATTGVGSVAITQGTLAASANYTLTFVNGALTITPRPITITADSLSRIYGNANPALTFSVGGLGLVNGDQLTGALATAANSASGVGSFAITQGTLAATANYAVTFAGGTLSITPRPITVTADSFSRIYGNANPTFTFTVGGLGLVNGDQLSGALTTAANATTGVGTFAITQGTLAAGANYALTFVNGGLTITPRPIIITADNLAKFAGQPDPALTFTVGGDGLVNNDQLTGALAREAGEALRNFAIGIGSLAAGPNYLVTFVAGQLTINPPPAPPEVNNPISLDPAITPGDPTPSATDEEEARFGIDFPAQPDAPLIEEEVLLDEPVTSGGDPTLYSSGVTPPAGSQ